MLRFSCHYDERPWGGRMFEEAFGRDLPEGTIGESWELAELPKHHSAATRGEHEGKVLGELWRSGALGGSASGPFPLLLKWLDTSDWLSVQVHPDEETCQSMGIGEPKTEAWYIAHAKPGGSLLAGHYPGLDGTTMRTAAEAGSLRKWMYELHPSQGDMILMNAGTLHALGPGLLVLEVQQPSDTTYRVFDWNRVDTMGRGRELHLDQATQSVRFDKHGPPSTQRGTLSSRAFHMQAVPEGESLPGGRLRILAAPKGKATLTFGNHEEVLNRGDIVVAEESDGTLTLTSGELVWISEGA